MENGETILQALKREMMEDHKELIQDYTFVRPDGHNVVGMNFLVKAKSDKVVLSDEFDRYKWVNVSELTKIDHIPGIEKVAESLFNK